MCKRDYKTGRCVDCGGPCSRRAERCRSCRELFRWRNPDDPRRVPPYPLTPDDPLWPKCACGCGEPVPARKGGSAARGFVKGEPCKFVAGHSNRVRIKLPVDGKLLCPRCSRLLPVAEFHASKSRVSGYAANCRACVAERTARWAAENPEKRAEAARRYRRARPEVHERAAEKYRKTEKHLRNARKYAAARRARKREQFVEDVDPIVVYERDRGICGICGEPVARDSFHVDHIIPLARGGEHSYLNVQVAHPRCNCSKRDRLEVA